MPQSGGAIKAPKPKKSSEKEMKAASAAAASAYVKSIAPKTTGPATLKDISKADRIGGKNNPSKRNAKGVVVAKATSSAAYKAGFTNEKSYTKGGSLKQGRPSGSKPSGGTADQGVSRAGRPKPRPTGSIGSATTVTNRSGGGTQADAPPVTKSAPTERAGRGGGTVSTGPTLVTGDTARPGRGGQDPTIDVTKPSASFQSSFSSGSGEGGGGGGGGSGGNVLTGGSLSSLENQDVESIVSGSKKGRRQKLRSKRGTE